jgi:predicted AlkP superfamily pyrophosphatase or phosphodiesterase
MPNFRSIARQAFSAEAMVTTFRRVTRPSYTSLITGMFPARHGVPGNSVRNRETLQEVKYIGDSVLAKDEAMRVLTLCDVAHKAGLSTASVI